MGSGVAFIREVAAAAARQSRELLARWLPAGREHGGAWVVGNLAGDPGESLVVQLHDGGWKDYASGEAGGDLVCLYAKRHGLGQLEAAKAMAREVGVEDRGGAAPPATPGRPGGEAPAAQEPGRARREADEWPCVRPVPDDAPDWRPVLAHPRWGQASRHWWYVDGEGRRLMVVTRWDVPGGKEIRQYTLRRHVTTGVLAWRCQWIDRPWPLYHLDQLAAAPSAPVILCEGEKAADEARRFAVSALVTTSPGGAQNAKHVDWSPLAGRSVLLWPDAEETEAEYQAYLAEWKPKRAGDQPRKRDVSGTAYVQVAEALLRQAGARELKIVDRARLAAQLGMAELPRGYDAADIPDGAAIDLRAVAVPLVDAGGGGPGTGGRGSASGGGGRGGGHQAFIDALQAYLDDAGLAIDALDCWRERDGWRHSRENTAGLALSFLFDYRHTRAESMTYAVETLEALATRAREKRRAELLSVLVGRPSNPAGMEALREWVRAVTGSDPARDREALDRDCAVLAHWTWLVKRQALGMPTAFDLMPVLYGKQESGKTTAVELLTRPLAELAVNIKAVNLTDDRYVPLLANAIVGRWEEMSGAQRSDLEALKSTITSPTVSYRPMRTNRTDVLRRTCCFIGTSNLPVDNMIQDTTGARRFAELRTPVRCDWDRLAKVDPELVWQAVSEHAPAPILPYKSLLVAHQAELVHRDPIAMWLEAEAWDKLTIYRPDSEQPMIVGAYNPAMGYSFEDLAARLGYWCRTVGQAPVGTRALSLRLPQEGFTQARPDTSTGVGRRRRYFVPPKYLSGSAAPVSSQTTAQQPPPPPQEPDDGCTW